MNMSFSKIRTYYMTDIKMRELGPNTLGDMIASDIIVWRIKIHDSAPGRT